MPSFLTPKEITFEIADECWIEAEMHLFLKISKAYPSCHLEEMKMIPLKDIRPLVRDKMFDKIRMVNILKGFYQHQAIPPIIVHKLPIQDEFIYEIRNGVHRFYASIAAKFENIPSIVVEYFDINSQ